MHHRRVRTVPPVRRISAICAIALVVSVVPGIVVLAPSVGAARQHATLTTGSTPTIRSPALAVAAQPVTPASLTFAPQQPHTSSPPQQLTFTNTTGSAINVQRSEQPGDGLLALSGCSSEPALLPGQSCVLSVVFQPSFGGPQTATADITFYSNNSTSVRVPVTIHWLPIVYTPSTPLHLGSVSDGQTSSTATVSLRNFWTVGTSVTSIHTTPGSGFTVMGSTCGGALPSGATCTVGVSYSPGMHVGPATGDLIATGPWGGPGQETLPLQAIGVAGPIVSVSPASLSFPKPQQVGTSSAPQIVTVTNVGTAPLSLTTTISGDVQQSYVVTNNCPGTAIAPGHSCQVSVVYRPSGEGVNPNNGRLAVFDNATPERAVQVPITTGKVLPLFFNPPSLSLPPTRVDEVSAPETITVRNFNFSSVTINGFRLPDSPDFEVSQFTCTGPLASGATCQIVVRAYPTKTGALSGQLVVSGPFYGTIATETFSLSGTGIAR
jgi:hypothetical protein